MSVSQLPHQRLTLPTVLAWPILIGGLLAIFATYWDEAWHTDIGRDSAWALPHILLYASIGVVGLGVAGWGLRALWATRSVVAVLRQRSLLAAGLGGIGALSAAPIDAAWHEAYGRDAVLWSPPHMLVVFAAAALSIGVLAGLPQQATAVKALACVLLTGNALAVVFEYEADVPQFTEVLYLPILLVTGLLVVGLTRRTLPTRAPVTTVVLGYAVLRLAVAATLALIGRSTPDLPIAVLGFALVDLPLRSCLQRYAAGIGAVGTLAWLTSLAGLASPAPGAVAVTAVPVITTTVLILVVSRVRRTRVLVPVAVAVAATAVALAWGTQPAEAHDPGQGQRVTEIELSVTSLGDGRLFLGAVVPGECDDLTPTNVVARRAGSTIEGPLRVTGECRFEGNLEVPAHGRWFAYVELSYDGAPVEAWLPIDADKEQSLTRTRELYTPAGATAGGRPGQVVLGVLIYAIGLGLLAAGVLAVRRPFELPATRPSGHLV